MLFATGAALGQRSSGYFFVAPGAVTVNSRFGTASDATLHLGFGGEWILWRGVGAGAEVGWLGPTSRFQSGFGVLCPNASYHFLRDSRLDPYVTGGYTVFVRDGAASLFNIGGGVNWWFRDRLGLKLELRDHIDRDGATVHFWGFRVGIAFR